MNGEILYSPSIMCADIGNLRNEVRELEEAGASLFHMDIMDGEFVPNFALSWADFAAVREMTDKPMDVHLMVKNPAAHIPFALKYGADIIYVHFEAGEAEKYLVMIREGGAKAGLAVNPETPIEAFIHLFGLLDKLLVMRVNPGFAGGQQVPEVEEKIETLLALNPDFEIALDGSVNMDAIARWKKRGIREFVLGTSCGLFGPRRNGRTYSEIIQNISEIK